MRPVTALLAAFLQVLLFGEALRGSMGNPLFKFSAAILYLAKLYAFIRHAGLDARVGEAVPQFPAGCRRAARIL